MTNFRTWSKRRLHEVVHRMNEEHESMDRSVIVKGDFLLSTFEESTVFPNIAFIDGWELSFYWVAQGNVMSIILEEDQYYVSYKFAGGNFTHLDGYFEDFPFEEVHSYMNRFTQIVNAANPTWSRFYEELPA